MDPIKLAIEKLAAAGIFAHRADEPWLELYNVSGHGELTRNQVFDLAQRLGVTRALAR